MIVLAAFIPVGRTQDKTTFPTDDEIELLLTQSDRAVQQYKPLVYEEELQLGKRGAKAAKDRQVIQAVETAVDADDGIDESQLGLTLLDCSHLKNSKRKIWNRKLNLRLSDRHSLWPARRYESPPLRGTLALTCLLMEGTTRFRQGRLRLRFFGEDLVEYTASSGFQNANRPWSTSTSSLGTKPIRPNSASNSPRFSQSAK